MFENQKNMQIKDIFTY